MISLDGVKWIFLLNGMKLNQRLQFSQRNGTYLKQKCLRSFT